MTAVRTACVVVPAHDEVERLPACLAALVDAAAVARAAHPAVTVRVVVVLDRCTDGSLAAARALGDAVEVLQVAAGSAGAARAAGVVHARRAAPCPPEELWLASTDADSRVPPAWLAQQLDLARTGVDLVLGTVAPDPGELPAEVLHQWRARHGGADLNIYGASLGMRLSCYDRAGGFLPLAEHEDVTLVRRVLQAGVAWAHGTHPVVTSARLVGRTPGGFSGYLGDLTRSLVAD